MFLPFEIVSEYLPHDWKCCVFRRKDEISFIERFAKKVVVKLSVLHKDSKIVNFCKFQPKIATFLQEFRSILHTHFGEI